jgi:1-phosphatidylinositol-4-phosphate 5-kinase
MYAGPNITPPHQLAHTFKFKAYAPKVFAKIRTMFGVEPAHFMLSICGNYNFIEFISNAKSGQFFFYSHDGRYMIKTQTDTESKFLRRIMPHFYAHLVKNPNSTLTHFYGMYRVKMNHLRRNVHFVIMKSVFNTDKRIDKVWDLKGSLVGRKAKEGESVFKDQDLLDEKFKVKIGPEKKKLFMAQLKSDVTFLAKLDIMDYSLLLGMHDRKKAAAVTTAAGSASGGVSRSDTPMRRTRREQHREEEGEGEEREGDANGLGGAGATTSIDAAYRRQQQQNGEKHGGALSTLKEERVLGSGGDDCDESNDLDRDEDLDRSDTDNANETETEDNSEDESEYGDAEDGGIHVGDIDIEGDGEDGEGGISRSTSQESLRNDSGVLTEEEKRAIESMVNGVHQMANPWTNRLDSGVDSIFGASGGGKSDEVYFAGIIDILQQYNSRKRAETFFKGLMFDTKQISCVDPDWYSQRFLEYMDNMLE